jgi:hypothetical protein
MFVGRTYHAVMNTSRMNKALIAIVGIVVIGTLSHSAMSSSYNLSRSPPPAANHKSPADGAPDKTNSVSADSRYRLFGINAPA